MPRPKRLEPQKFTHALELDQVTRDDDDQYQVTRWTITVAIDLAALGYKLGPIAIASPKHRCTSHDNAIVVTANRAPK